MTNGISPSDPRVVILQRTFNAPRDLVWEAWTQPEHIANWWGAKGMPTKVVEHDFQPGGNWRFHMIMPDGNEFPTYGTYQEIEVPERIVSTGNFEPVTMNVVLTMVFEDLGETTRFTFTVTHETPEYAKQQYEMGFLNGWGSVFEQLEGYLGSL